MNKLAFELLTGSLIFLFNCPCASSNNNSTTTLEDLNQMALDFSYISLQLKSRLLLLLILHVLEPGLADIVGVALQTCVFRRRKLLLIESGALALISVAALVLIFRGHFDSVVECVASEVLGLFFEQVVLLWTENRARSCDSDPPDEVRGREFEVLHRVAANEGPSPA